MSSTVLNNDISCNKCRHFDVCAVRIEQETFLNLPIVQNWVGAGSMRLALANCCQAFCMRPIWQARHTYQEEIDNQKEEA